MQPFFYYSIVFCLYTALQNQISKLSNFLVFRTSVDVLLRLAAFSLLIFIGTILSSSSVNCPSLISCWLLIILVRGLSVTLKEFPSRFLKFSFHICIHSSFLAAYHFALKVLFHLLSLHLLSAMIFVIVYLLPSFLFYLSVLECILVVLFGMC